MALPSAVQGWSLPVNQESWKTYKSLQLRDVKLSPLSKGEVLVKLHAASLNYRDIIIPQRLYPGPFSSGPDGLGHILTSDGAGEVVAVGEGVSEWKRGDRVHSSFSEDWVTGEFQKNYAHSALGGGISGCLVQYRVFPSHAIVRIPEHLTYEEAAAIPCAGLTAWASLFETKPIGPDSSVLALGSGGVSVFGVQLAKAVGARVIATTSSTEKASKYRALGADDVINYRETPEWSQEVLRLTEGKGVEHILEVGGPTTLPQSLKSAQNGGHIHILGFVGGSTSDFSFGELSMAMIFGRLHLHGQAVGSIEMLKRLDDFIAKHKIKPVVSKAFEWEQAIEALDYLAAGAHFGKVVIKIQ